MLDRSTVNAFTAGLLADGSAPATARARHMALRRFSAWLLDEGEISRDELIGLKPPKLDTKVVPRLTDDQCRALIKACTGREFIDRRDEALVRLMLETACRAGEVVAMNAADAARHWLTPVEAARRIGVSDQTIRNQIRAGNLRACRVGTRFRVDPASLAAFVQLFESAS